MISFPLCFQTSRNCVTNLRLTLVNWWGSQGPLVRMCFLMERQLPYLYLEDSCSLKSFSSSQIRLIEAKCFVLNAFYIWQFLPMVQQRLRGFCFRCSLTSFHPVSLYDIWPYMFSFCKYSGGISIDRKKNSVCMWIYVKNLNMHTCIALVYIYTHIYMGYICISREQQYNESWIELEKQTFKNYTHSTKIAGEPSLQLNPIKL